MDDIDEDIDELDEDDSEWFKPGNQPMVKPMARQSGKVSNRPLRPGENAVLLELVVNDIDYDFVVQALEFRMQRGTPMQIRTQAHEAQVTIRQISRR